MIPCVQWADESTFDFCFRSLPKHSVVAVSSIGCMNGLMSAKAFGLGYNRMVIEIDPIAVVFNGPKPNVDLEGPRRIYYDSRTGDKSDFDQSVQIDLKHKHNGLQPHAHDGKNHGEGRKLTLAETLDLDRILKRWEEYNEH